MQDHVFLKQFLNQIHTFNATVIAVVNNHHQLNQLVVEEYTVKDHILATTLYQLKGHLQAMGMKFNALVYLHVQILVLF